MSTPPAPDRPTLSAGKRRLFTALMLLLPVVFFVLLEGSLRVAGYGADYPLFVETEDPEGYRYQNREVARRYFAYQNDVPNSLLDFFAAEPDSSTLRIVVQGGSSGAGYPFYYGGAFSRMLEQRLMQTFPERSVEVVNTSMAAVNSYTLLDLSDEILEQHPDAVLIFAGHNEYYGALGVGSTERLGQLRPFVRLYLRLQGFRTVQALRDVLAWGATLFRDTDGGVPGATLMSRMVGEQSIPYGSPLYEAGLSQFRDNLSALLTRYERAGVPVFIGTMASNERDHAPFISEVGPETDADAWQAAYEAGLRAAAQGDTTAALARLSEAIRLDSIAADAYYARAQLHERLGRLDAARADYVAAKDRDQLRFRAPEAINDIIRAEAAEHGATVVDTRRRLADASPAGIVGASLMTEHLHPNVRGYFLIADAFYEALREAEPFGPWATDVPTPLAEDEILLTPVDSLVGYYRVLQLTRSWPFQPEGVITNVLDTLQARSPVEQIAQDVYRGEATWNEGTSALRAYYEQAGDYHHAMQAALALIQQYPFVDSYYLAAGNILVRQRRYDEALAYFEAANSYTESALAHRMIGSIYLSRNDHDVAIEHLERALELNPDDVPSLYNLSGAYAQLGRYDEARRLAQRVLELQPTNAAAQRLLSSLPS